MIRFLLFLLVAGLATAGTEAPPLPSKADSEHAALWDLWREPLPENLTRKDQAYWQHQDEHLRRFSATLPPAILPLSSEELCVSHPAVSRQPTELEDSLGLMLFTRTRTAMFPTEA